MATASVGVTFECVDEADAQAKIATWTLHEGCQVYTSVTTGSTDATTDEGGAIVERITLTELNPATVEQGVGEVQVHCLGSGFKTGEAKIVLNDVELPTAFVNSGDVYTTVNAAVGGHPAGTFDMLVRQGTQETGVLPFTIATV